ncbi:MAG: ABC transporter permease [Oscillospiraceae bacterium]|nr:ABC transporter permease [Oscillospiraceae bacterium]MBQ5567490.1 ABC transporter permease [Oscillospiraceae bacterium]
MFKRKEKFVPAKPVEAPADLPADLFEAAEQNSSDLEYIARKHHSALYDGWIRLRKNKAAVICAVILIVITLFAIFAPILGQYTYFDTNYKAKLKPPSIEHPFGTDQFGRDQWARIWYGTRISLLIGLVAALLNLFIGVIYGAVSAMIGGRVDAIMQRIIEILVGVPHLIIVILFMMILPPGVGTIVIAMSITGWVNMARLVRAQILKLKNQEFVMAAKLLGTSGWKMIMKHLVPNTVSVIVIQIMFAIPSAIFTEAFLSFIGVGLAAPKASLGVLINDGYKMLRAAPYMLIYPALAIILIMVCFSILGDGLRDALDPRMKH